MGRRKPFFKDPETAQASVEKLKRFDADENVFVAIAHDEGLGAVCDFFPKTMNGWKAKGWKHKATWGFLNALPPGRDPQDAPGPRL
ncbi:Cytochrome P450-like protein 73 [Elsinoe fawcettii]|nr:Cytochrome P450-like protein 73 [Elsinoe fawcettii]